MLKEGYTPTYEKRVDPFKGRVSIEVAEMEPAPDDDSRVARGRLLDDTGKPVAGAVVYAESVRRENGTSYGAIEGLQKYAVSDTAGTFFIVHAKAADAIGVEIRAPGLAPKRAELDTGGKTHEIKLDVGATLNGRLVLDGKGIAGVVMGLCQTNRSAGVFMGEFTIATREDGAFTFNNIPTGQEYVLYGKMDSLKRFGATGVKKLRVDRADVSVGDLSCTPGSTVTGRVVLTDGAKVPPDTRILLSADQAWDSQMCIMDAEGRFRFTGVPKGLYGLSLRLRGYRPTARNKSLIPSSARSLSGRVDSDISGLVYELEPGSVVRPKWTQELWKEEQARKKRPLRGAEK